MCFFSFLFLPKLSLFLPKFCSVKSSFSVNTEAVKKRKAKSKVNADGFMIVIQCYIFFKIKSMV